MTDRPTHDVLPFRHYLRVRYSECDAQKVVFHSRFSDYVDLGTTEFMRALGSDLSMVEGALDYQTVRQTISWSGPARFDQVLEVRVRLLRLGNTSFTLAAEIRRADSGEILATAESVYVLVDAATLEKRNLPDNLRQALQLGAAGRHSDHAGWFNSCQTT